MAHASIIHEKGEGMVGENSIGVWKKNVSFPSDVETYKNEDQEMESIGIWEYPSG